MTICPAPEFHRAARGKLQPLELVSVLYPSPMYPIPDVPRLGSAFAAGTSKGQGASQETPQPALGFRRAPPV
jgi:hypothetical protein